MRFLVPINLLKQQQQKKSQFDSDLFCIFLHIPYRDE